MTKALTVHVDEGLLEHAERTATQERKPLSQWVTDLIAREVDKRPDFEEARRDALYWLDRGFNLGGVPLTREEAHRRRP